MLIGSAAMREAVTFRRDLVGFKGTTAGEPVTLMCQVTETRRRVAKNGQWDWQPARRALTRPEHLGQPVDVEEGDVAVYQGRDYTVVEVTPIRNVTSGRLVAMEVVIQ